MQTDSALAGFTNEHVAALKALAGRVASTGRPEASRLAGTPRAGASRCPGGCQSFVEAQTLRQELDEARRSLSTKARQLELLESVKDAFDADRRVATSKVETLAKEREREVAELRSEVAALREKFAEAGREHQDVVTRVVSELTLVRSRSATAQQESGLLRSDLERTKRELSAKVEALQDLQQGYERAEAEVSEKGKEITELRESLRGLEQVSQYRTSLAEREADIVSLEENLRQLRFQLKEAADTQQNHQEQMNLWNKDLQRERTRAVEAEKCISQLRSDLEAAVGEEAKLHEQREVLQRDLLTSQAELEDVRRNLLRDVARSKDELQRGRTLTAAAEETASRLRAELETEQAEMRVLRADRDRLTNELGCAESAAANARKLHDAAAVSLQRYQSECHLLRDSFIGCCKHAKELEQHIELIAIQGYAGGVAPYPSAV